MPRRRRHLPNEPDTAVFKTGFYGNTKYGFVLPFNFLKTDIKESESEELAVGFLDSVEVIVQGVDLA